MSAGDLIAEGCLDYVRDAERTPAAEEPIGHLLEATLVKKDGSKASVQLSTSPVFSGDQVIAFQHIARDVTEEKRMKENLRFYLREVTRAQEEERKRIARELHDDTIQALIVLSRQLDDLAAKGRGLSEEKRPTLEGLWEQTKNIMEGLRHLSQDLRPPALDSLGLVPALESLAADIGGYSGLKIELKTSGAVRRLSPDAELVLFRIAQEALRNVWRHSQATSAEVTIEFGRSRTG